MRLLIRPALVGTASVVLAMLLTLAAAIALGGRSSEPQETGPIEPASVDQAGRAGLDALVPALQSRLRAQRRDHRAWSTLGLAYVEQARVSADPTYYPKAEQALDEAARLSPGDDLMLTGRATLAAARHDFTAALRLADRALAVNSYSAQAHAVRSDALTELGRYDEARAAAGRADELRPGSSTFARLSYAAELRGDLSEARRLMRRAEEAATSPAERAFAALHLGELARVSGEPAEASRAYADALRVDPTYAPALAGRARLAVAAGDVAAAVRDYLAVVRRLPTVEYVVELGELYQATGRADLAARQFAVASASARLARANGVGTDLETALFEADHGSAAAALAAARAEWNRRHTVHTADALAWALHATGRDREALRYTRQATALGTRDARLVFHRGVIEAATGNTAQARRYLSAALAFGAGASPWRDRQARRLLTTLGGVT